jgi:hypothetical protein
MQANPVIWGQEEIETISPVIKDLQARGHDVQGPFPADTLFQPKYLQNSDAVLAMFHDQGFACAQTCKLWSGRECVIGTANCSHFGGPRYCARPGWHAEYGCWQPERSH